MGDVDLEHSPVATQDDQLMGVAMLGVREDRAWITHLENIQVNDLHLPAFHEVGCVESFRHLEMWRGNPPASLTGTSP